METQGELLYPKGKLRNLKTPFQVRTLFCFSGKTIHASCTLSGMKKGSEEED